MVPGTGAIVASADTQGPYGEDWIRDGAFINEVLDYNRYSRAVTTHNRFYARVQTSPTNPSALRPPGNWPMASYGDGIDGAPVPWEIDETGLGIWTLYRHFGFLRGKDAKGYLAEVYPAITRAADFLTACVDPSTGLQCPASEDDNYTPSQSIKGAMTTVLGLRSAVSAAGLVGDRSVRVALWRQRLENLLVVIDKRLYDSKRREYTEGDTTGNAYNAAYQEGGWLLWPVQIKAASDPVMRDEAKAVQRTMEASFAAPFGEYESRGLLGLAHQWSRPTPAQTTAMKRDLAYIARTVTTPTGLFGEAWKRFSDHRPRPVEDMPHVWEHALFYLESVQIEGSRRYGFQRQDTYQHQCATRRAPAAACSPRPRRPRRGAPR
jgi:GH15 family glucan-1,4-alpha-glucosidase